MKNNFLFRNLNFLKLNSRFGMKNTLIKYNIRYFAHSGHNNHKVVDSTEGQPRLDHGHLENNDHHDDHGHDEHHHHEITGEVDLNKVYVPIDSTKSKYISLMGIPHEHKVQFKVFEGELKAQNQITSISIPLITRSRIYFKDLSNVTYEENPYFHPEPYGYLTSDDVIIFFILNI
jgi:hypothetical protein